MQLAGKALAGVKYVKSLVNVEMKKFDTGASLTTADTVNQLNAVGQGDADAARDGNSILQKSLLIRATLSGNSNVDTGLVRVLIFVDKQQIGDSSPALSDVLDPTPGNNIIAPLNNETVGRFTILFDRTYSVNSNLDATAISLPWKFYRKMNQHARFNGANTTDIQKNGLYIAMTHNMGVNTPTFAYSSRLTFIDN